MNVDSLKEIITQNYEIEPIINIEKTSNDNGKTFYINSENKKYVIKLNDRPDFVQLYEKIESVLTGLGYIQSKIVKTNKNELLTAESAVLYTFLHGESHKKLNISQTANAIKYIKHFNSALLNVPFDPQEIKELNIWDKAKSLDFLINHFEYKHLSLEDSYILLLNKAIKILSDNMSLLSKIPKQLIHSDLGPDNFLFQNDNVYSIIDFTPEYENEIYSLCQFCYWNYHWISIESEQLINDCLKIYYQRNASEIEKEIFNIFMVKAALFRIAGVIMAGNVNLENRFNILKRIL
jgi:Ser/Thr protein kinase RdoA (MazF antagonist)